MNFYEHQDRAERRTKFIVFLFVLAVLCIVLIVVIPVGLASEWEPAVVAVTAVVCLLIVGIATLVKLGQLRGGGSVVAEMMGGTQLQRGGSTQSEKRVQNIVEEMAIASGMPVPPVYIMEDDSINAFAAGWSVNSAVISVTRGCIEKLNRDELQGVIAHEYSHIAHGDMRINIRLIGVIFGIMALGITGWILARYVGPVVLRSSARSRSKEGAGGAGIGLAIIVFGLFLALCGFVGTLFGRLIQAAASRQREFLADASAVQYTRNPSGIGGALRKIGGLTPISTTRGDASQCNHMFFSQAMKAMFASHPPITERVARVEGIDVSLLPEVVVGVATVGTTSNFSSSVVKKSVSAAGVVGGDFKLKAQNALSKIGETTLAAVRDPWSARLVMFAILCKDGDEGQQKILAKNLSVEELVEVRRLLEVVPKDGDLGRLPLIDLAAPALRQLGKEQKKTFGNIVSLLIKSDGVVDLFEWAFVAVVKRHILGSKKHKSNGALKHRLSSASLVIGALAYGGSASQKQTNDAFKAAVSSLGYVDLGIPDKASCSVSNMENAIQDLLLLKFIEKERLLQACVVCITHDEKITVTEAETLRAIGDLLGCPVPIF